MSLSIKAKSAFCVSLDCRRASSALRKAENYGLILRQLSTGNAVDFSLNFDAPQWAAKAGQSAVLYDGEMCLGGG